MFRKDKILKPFNNPYFYIILIIVSIVMSLLTGCDNKSKEYRKFYHENGDSKRYYCEDGSLYKEVFLYEDATQSQKYLINSQKCINKQD